MKKVLILFFILFFYTSAAFATEPCGKMYKYFNNDVNYLLKFSDKVEEFPCTSGTVSFYWFDKKLEYLFSVDSNDFIKINGMGLFTVYKDKLYYLDTTEIILEEF